MFLGRFKAQWIDSSNFEFLQYRDCPVSIQVQLKYFISHNLCLHPPVTFKKSWFKTKIHKPNPLFTNIDEYISGSLNNGLYPRLCNGDLFQFSSMISFTLGICRLKSPIPGNLRPKASSHQMTMPKNLIWIYNTSVSKSKCPKNMNYNLLKMACYDINNRNCMILYGAW